MTVYQIELVFHISFLTFNPGRQAVGLVTPEDFSLRN